MKKLLLAVIVLAMSCYACKKEAATQKPDITNNDEKFDVNFSVSALATAYYG